MREIVISCYIFVLIEKDSRKYLTEEEINEIINNSSSNIDSSDSDLEISGNDCDDNGDTVMGEAGDITNMSQFLVDSIENSNDVGLYRNVSEFCVPNSNLCFELDEQPLLLVFEKESRILTSIDTHHLLLIVTVNF